MRSDRVKGSCNITTSEVCLLLTVVDTEDASGGTERSEVLANPVNRNFQPPSTSKYGSS